MLDYFNDYYAKMKHDYGIEDTFGDEEPEPKLEEV